MNYVGSLQNGDPRFYGIGGYADISRKIRQREGLCGPGSCGPQEPVKVSQTSDVQNIPDIPLQIGRYIGRIPMLPVSGLPGIQGREPPDAYIVLHCRQSAPSCQFMRGQGLQIDY